MNDALFTALAGLAGLSRRDGITNWRSPEHVGLWCVNPSLVQHLCRDAAKNFEGRQVSMLRNEERGTCFEFVGGDLEPGQTVQLFVLKV